MEIGTFYRRLNGSHLFGPGVFFSTLAFGLVAHFLGSTDLAAGHLPARVFAVVLAHLIMMAVAGISFWLTRKLPASRAALALVFFGIILAGAARGLVLQVALYELGAANQAFSFYRLYGGVVALSSGLIWAIYAFGLKAEWGGKRAKLQATQVQLAALLAESEKRLDAEASDTLSTIESMLQTALIPELMVTPQAAVVKLQSLINDTLRPLSAFLSASQPKVELPRFDESSYKFRWRLVARHLQLRPSSRPLTLSLILSTLAINFFSKYLPQSNLLLLLAVAFASLSATLLIARQLVAPLVDRLNPVVRVPLVLLSLFGSGLIAGLVLVLWLGASPAIIGFAFNAAISVTLVGSLFGLNQAATLEIEDIEQQLINNERQLRWAIASINARHWLQKKQFARKLHGPIQSEVAAAAIRLERSLNDSTVTASGEQVMQNLRERLARILGDSSSTAELSAVIEEIAETWRGLCNIEVSFEPEVESAISQDQICVETVLEIIREACSNAIRHGSAERIWLTLEIEDSDLVKVTVTNDGNALDNGGKPGLGSAYLDDCTFSHERVVAGDLMTLKASVPLHK